jgi:formyl-CoA transferase/CoA:oxalate CoA-transferase
MPEFKTDGMRIRNRADLASRIEAITTAKARAHWLQLFDANGVPCGPINDYSQVFEDPQVIARELVVDVEHPTLGAIRTLGSAIKLSATPADVRRRAPLLGEHTEEVLSEVGIRDPESDVLSATSPRPRIPAASSERTGDMTKGSRTTPADSPERHNQ